MCGIVGAVSTRNIVPVLVQGLQRLEYRGYDSCGVAVWADGLKRARSTSRVAELIAQVHNGIIENHDELRAQLQARGYVFASQTDTEVIAHLIDSLYDGDLFEAVQAALAQLHGAYAIAVLHKDEPHRVVGARAGSPLILGVGRSEGEGAGENFLASDAMALAGVTDQIVYLEEGDVVDVQLGRYWVLGRDAQGALKPVTRPVRTVHAHSGAADLPLPALHAKRDLRAASRHCR